MLVNSVRVRNFRSIIDSGRLDLGPVTLIIGANNSGKSALLRSLMMGHGASQWDQANVRYGEAMASVYLRLDEAFASTALWTSMTDLRGVGSMTLEFHGDDEGLRSLVSYPTTDPNSHGEADVTIYHTRPRHMFVPVLTRRRAPSFDTHVGTDAASIVGLDDRSLASRLTTLSGNHPEARRYREAMRRVLDIEIATFPVRDGMTPGVALDTRSGIALDNMGDGVRGVTTLISELVDTDQPRVFLIEEPENDLHPAALVALLQEIRQAAEHHQFIVTTHSDVVLRELGSLSDSRLYRTEVTYPFRSSASGASEEITGSDVPGPPGSAVLSPVETGPEGVPTTTFVALEDELDRRSALASLGYVQELPAAWLILEESTAERFIRECLIPMFAPRLAALQTVASRGVGDVKRTVTAFHRMVLFARLADNSVPRAWVLVDGDEAGQKAVDALKGSFASWPSDRFVALDEANIEAYYPARFGERVNAIAREHGRRKQDLKGELVEDVVAWAAQGSDDIKAALEQSAAALIAHLRRVEEQVRDLQLGRYR